MKLLIRTLLGECYEINVEKTTTIYEVKHIIFQNFNIPVEIQKLIFAGKFIEDEKSLGEYNIQCSTCLYLVTPKRKIKSARK